ncbi:heparan-alpha-glucosaminide N-acetyltransferase domain-containing protein, partial [Streptomyces sp. T-3]|nr:heparan-alpha-glucosaminide N-acetyltransferase domain-containing protein [Streptomyces sp. T-3]
MAGDTTRLTGLDAARGIAVLGMFAVHVGPPPEPAGAGWLLVAADGRAPAVFTLIAGFSLALARQRQRQQEGWRPLLIRSAVLGLLGLLLAGLSPGFLVILAFYSVYFLAAEPFTRLRTRTLAIVAAVSATAGPVASYVLGDLLGHRTSGRGGTPVPQDLATWSGFGEMAEKLLLTGAYPLLTYFPYVLIGLTLGRLATRTGPAGLHRPRTGWLLAAWGSVAAVAGYGLSWLIVERGGARRALLDAIAREHPWALNREDPIGAVLGSQYGAIPSTSWDWLAVAGPYSQTPLETIGNAGVGAALIGLAVAAARAPL